VTDHAAQYPLIIEPYGKCQLQLKTDPLCQCSLNYAKLLFVKLFRFRMIPHDSAWFRLINSNLLFYMETGCARPVFSIKAD
jgi:hypothetical protein